MMTDNALANLCISLEMRRGGDTGQGRGGTQKFLTVEVHSQDVKSRLLAERLGFTREGHLRECGYENGRRFGLLYYGMLREEYVS